MTKMFKKAISLLVVCALAFTTLATGVFAAAVPTISLDAVATDLTIGDEAVVTVTSANSIGDWGAYQAKVTIPDGLTVKTVMYKLDDYEAVELEALNSVDYVPGDPWYNVKNNVISFVDVIATASTVVYTITFDAIEAAGTYAVVAALATADAEILEESEQTVNFVVSEAHTCVYDAYTSNGDGTHKVACACGEVSAEAEACDTAAEDGACSKCGYKAEVACAHENTTATFETLADGTTYGKCVTTYTCDDCADVVKTVEITNRQFWHAPVYEANLVLIYRCNKADLENVYTDIHAVFTKDMYEGTLAEDGVTYLPAVSDPIAAITATNNAARYQFSYNDTRAKEMSSNVNVAIYGTDADGDKILLAGENYSFDAYIKQLYNARINATAGTKNAAERQLIVDIANYGAAAQNHFGYRTDVLPNRTDILPEDAQQYATDTITDFAVCEVNSATKINKAADYKDKVLFNLRFQKSLATEGSKMVVAYKNTAGESLEAEYLYEDYADYDNNRYQVVFDQMTAATMSVPFTATVYDAEGNATCYLTYSLENYAKGITGLASTKESEKLLVNELIAYGRSANAYFNFGK